MIESAHARRFSGFTLFEMLTALVVVGTLVAVAVPTWHSHLLRVRRADAMEALGSLESAQDAFFGRHTRYASATELTLAAPGGLGLATKSAHGLYSIELATTGDGLGYLATARAIPLAGQDSDSRCAEFSIDHDGRRRARDSSGVDRTADCWH